MGKRLKITAIVIVFAAFCLIGCTVSFKYESVIKAARARGIKPVVLTVFEKYQKSGEFEGVDAEKSRHYYFVSKDNTEANSIYVRYFRLDDDSNVSVDVLACCADDDDGILYFRAASEEDAKKIFDEWETSLKEDYEKTSYGSKNGYVYIVGSNYGTEDPYDRSDIGIYRKGKDVFIVGESYDSQNAKEDSFFENLGLVKPADAIK